MYCKQKADDQMKTLQDVLLIKEAVSLFKITRIYLF